MSSNSSIKPLNNTELSIFCDQIAMMLKAGISTYEGLTILYDDAETKIGKEIYASILKELEVGDTFHHALEQSGVFPKYVLDMVHLGEMSGKLESVLNSLSGYYEREENIAQGIRHAIAYPLVMTAMLLVVILVLITKVLPVFADVYQQLGSELTGISLTLLNLGTLFSRYTSVIVIVFVLLVVLGFILSRTSFGRSFFRKHLLQLLFTREFRHNMAASRFAGGMSLALNSGLDIDQGMDLTASLVDNPDMYEQIKECQKLTATGEGFAHALAVSGIFTTLYSRMISIGFKSGSMDTVLEKIAVGYEERTNDSITRFISLLEPTLIIILSVIVGLILLSVLLPLLGIMTTLS